MKNESAAPECLGLNLRMSARALSAIYDEAVRPVGLRGTQFSLLRAVQKYGPVTFQRLAEVLYLDETTLPRSLRLLEKRGYIRIEPGRDKRERLTTLTAKGKAVVEKALPLWRGAQERLKRKLTPERFERFIADLAEMRAAAAR